MLNFHKAKLLFKIVMLHTFQPHTTLLKKVNHFCNLFTLCLQISLFSVDLCYSPLSFFWHIFNCAILSISILGDRDMDPLICFYVLV
jgi:hypothetical protein